MDTSSSAQNPVTNTMAIISLVTALLSWLVLPTIGAVVAIVTGYMARREIRESGGTQTGDVLAVLGIVLGALNIVVSCVGLLVFVLIFGGLVGLSGCAILNESVSYLPALP